MFQFNLTQEPLSAPELKAEISVLKETRKKQIKQSCISDVLHAFVFIGLYFSGQIGGYAILVAVAISTVAAISVAMYKSQKSAISHSKAMLIAVSVALLIFCTLNIKMLTAIPGSSIAALLGFSIVIVGSTLGRKVKAVLTTLEEMKTFQDDPVAQHELSSLCHQYPQLEDYRELAAQNLRPHLTYGELAAMKHWSEQQKTS